MPDTSPEAAVSLLLDLDDAEALLRLSQRTLRRMAAEGSILRRYPRREDTGI